MTKEVDKNRNVIIYAFSSLLMLFDVLYNQYGYIHDCLGITSPVIDYLLKFLLDTGLFNNVWISKIGVLFLLIISSFSRSFSDDTSWKNMISAGISGIILFISSVFFQQATYIIMTMVGYIFLLYFFSKLSGKLNVFDGGLDDENDTFMQDTVLRTNDDSVNIPTKFQHKRRTYKGWINVVNPFRATIVLGTPGSGKSFAVYNYFIKQMIEKGYTMYLYDYKYPDLTYEVYNRLRFNSDKFKVAPAVFIINFDDPEYTHRCNPINPIFLNEIMDAYEAAYTVMINLNKSWVQKQGDFFVESPIILFAAIIWYLRIYQDGKYCTLPHAIEMLMSDFAKVFDILKSYEELHNYLTPFINAYEQGAQDQLQGQIASAQIPLSRVSSPTIYWVMSGDDFTLDINNPEEPKIVCVGNNPDRQNIYGAALSLYNSRIFKIINKKGKLKSAVLLDELPTIYIKGLDNLIATARSNRVAIVIGAQDQSQIIRDYGDKEADVIYTTVGNLFSGMVKGRTAENLSKAFGKSHKQRKSTTQGENNQSISLSYQQEDILPSSVIGSLSQGVFVGQVADNFDQKIQKKFFHAEIQVNIEEAKKEAKSFVSIPRLATCSNHALKDLVNQNYSKIKQEVKDLIKEESLRLGIKD